MQNFMAIKEASLDLYNRGLVLIEGENKSNDSFTSNGASKTSLITSITYALYGKTEKGLKSDDVVNNIEKKDTFVKLTFMIGEDEYRIERYRKHKKFKNKVLLFCNEEEITGSTVDVTDKQILDLFGIEFNAYVNAIMYGQGDIPMFSQATDKGKKEILESITKVDIYRKAQEVAKAKLQEVKEGQFKIEHSINMANSNISFLERQEEEELLTYQNNLRHKKEKEEELRRLQEELVTKEEQVKVVVDKLKNQLTEINVEPFKYSDNYKNLQTKLSEYTEGIRKLELKKQSIKSAISSTTSTLKSLDTSDSCPVCGSPIDNSHKVKEGESLRNKLEKLNEGLVTIDYHLGEFIKHKQNVEAELRKEDSEKTQHDMSIHLKYSEQNEIREKINNMEKSLYSYRDKVSILQGSIDAYSTLEKPVGKKEEIDKLKKSIDNMNSAVLELESKKARYNEAIEAFSNKGIRSVVLDFITPFLNEKANEYLTVLSGSDISVEFQTQTKNASGELRDKFDVVVKNSVGGDSYKSNSAGEQRRIDLAISFAIQDLIMSKDDISTNIALYDECFDGLDLIGCENVVKLLKDRLSKVGTIFVITHSENLKPLFENSITMVKENGIAYLKEENK